MRFAYVALAGDTGPLLIGLAICLAGMGLCIWTMRRRNPNQADWLAGVDQDFADDCRRAGRHRT